MSKYLDIQMDMHIFATNQRIFIHDNNENKKIKVY
jgi:hypothetical protein